MDLTKSILDQLSGDNLDKLSSQLGASPKAAKSAAEAAVPTILSSLAGLAGSDDGAKKLSSALGGLDLGSLGNLSNMLGDGAGEVAQKGGGLLNSLLGDGLVSSIAGAIGRYAGLDAATTKKILAYVMPLVLAKVGSAWKGKGSTPSALQGLFADQKAEIANAVPPGFSLNDIPGFRSTDAAVRMVDKTASAASDATRRAASAASSPATWLMPLAVGLLIALGLWYFFKGRQEPNVARNVADTAQNAAQAVTANKPVLPDLPEVPNVAAVTKDVTGVFTSAKQSLAGIRDAATAEAALPKLTDLDAKISGIRNLLDKMPSATQTALGKLVGEQFEPLQEQAAKVLAMPGASEEVKSSLQGITSKLAGLNLAGVSQNATDIFSSLTTTLNGFTDPAEAEAALPKLQAVSGKIDELKRVQANMSPGGQSMLAKLISTARGPLNELIAKVLTKLGADATVVKPVLDEIVNKLAGLAAPPDTRT